MVKLTIKADTKINNWYYIKYAVSFPQDPLFLEVSMKNQHESLGTDAKPKMLFNSDGFNFLVKFMTVLFTVIGAVLLVALKIIGALCASSSKSSENNDHIDNYVSLDPLKTEGENKVDGTGYYK